MSGYDLNELRRCLTLAFSPGELDELAQSVGVFPPPRDDADPRGMDETARLLLRTLQARGQLVELVTRLRREKPLVEWPERELATELEPAPEPEHVNARPAPGSQPEQELESEPEPEPKPEPEEAAQADAPDVTAPTPLLVSAAEEDEAARRRKLRWAAVAGAGAAILIVAVIGAFLMGRASSSDDDGALEPAANIGPAALAGPAAAELDRAVRAVAKACALPDGRGPAPEVLARAFKSCSERGDDRAGRLLGPTPDTPGLDASGTGEPAAARPGAARPAPRRPEPASGESNCLQRCERLHEGCRSRECGAEPTKGSEYADYQRCLSKCLRKASQCRLRCG